MTSQFLSYFYNFTMKKLSTKEKIISESKKDSTWISESEKRQLDEDWLELSFSIALKVLRYLRANKISQKKLAEQLDWSPQYLGKVLKGNENLTLETICKIQNATGLILIQVPSFSEEPVLSNG